MDKFRIIIMHWRLVVGSSSSCVYRLRLVRRPRCYFIIIIISWMASAAVANDGRSMNNHDDVFFFVYGAWMRWGRGLAVLCLFNGLIRVRRWCYYIWWWRRRWWCEMDGWLNGWVNCERFFIVCEGERAREKPIVVNALDTNNTSFVCAPRCLFVGCADVICSVCDE